MPSNAKERKNKSCCEVNVSTDVSSSCFELTSSRSFELMHLPHELLYFPRQLLHLSLQLLLSCRG